MHPSKFGVSQSVTRKEDDALMRGRGRYVADVAPAGTLHAVVLRSPHAHARFRITDIAVARGLPGRASRAHRARHRRAGRAALRRHSRGREGRRAALSGAGARRGPPCRRCRRLHRRRHRRAGEGRRRGDIDRLGAAAPCGRRPSMRSSPGAPPVWPERAGNAAFEMTLGDQRATADAFAAAAKIVSLSVVNQRLVTNFLDTRAVVAEYDAATDRITLDARQPGLAPRARHSRQCGAQDRAGKAARGDAGCRRRLRHQAVSLSRIRARGGRGEAARARR